MNKNTHTAISPLGVNKRGYTFVSLGPGGRDNMTLGTYDALMKATHIFCFGSSGKSYALDIMVDAGIDISKVTVVEIPMRDNRHDAFAVYDALVEQLKTMDGNTVIATEGDTSIYATTHYVMDRLQADGYEVRQTAGVPSFIAAGAMAGISLVSQHQRLLVVPGKIDEAELNEKLTSEYTIVIMKLSRLKETIHSFIASHPEYEYHYIEKVGTPSAVHITDKEILQELDYPYFSLMIIAQTTT